MTIHTLYSLNCTQCGTSMCEPLTGSWTFEGKEEALEIAKSIGWSVNELVQNGSLWDFCPRCIKRNKQEG